MSKENTLVLESVDSVEGAETICIRATNRQALIDCAWGGISAAYPDGDYPDLDVFLRVEMASCKSVREYKTEDDVPAESVPCDCGNPKHWLIKYEEEKCSRTG